MKLTDIVIPQAVVTELEPTDRDEVIAALLEALVAAEVVSADLREQLMRRILAREEKGSTGFGKGVAVPHVKHPEIDRIAAAIGVSENGIEFNSLDRQPVYSIFLLLSPEGRPEDHLQAMEVIFKNLSKDAFRRFLRQATSPEEVVSLLDEADAQQIAG